MVDLDQLGCDVSFGVAVLPRFEVWKLHLRYSLGRRLRFIALFIINNLRGPILGL